MDNPDVADQPTMTLWRRPPVQLERRPRIGRILALLALASVLLGAIGYGVGRWSAGGNTPHTDTSAPAKPTATTAWRFTWQQSGHGTAVVTPPALTARDTPRFLLSWTCRASVATPGAGNGEAMKLIISLFQDDHSRRSVAYIACPGYGNAAITVGSAPDAMLHFGPYSVLITAPGDAPWTLAVQESRAAH